MMDMLHLKYSKPRSAIYKKNKLTRQRHWTILGMILDNYGIWWQHCESGVLGTLEGSAVIDEGQTSLSSLVFPAPFLAID
jgi:hypothetical protein